MKVKLAPLYRGLCETFIFPHRYGFEVYKPVSSRVGEGVRKWEFKDL